MYYIKLVYKFDLFFVVSSDNNSLGLTYEPLSDIGNYLTAFNLSSTSSFNRVTSDYNSYGGNSKYKNDYWL